MRHHNRKGIKQVALEAPMGEWAETGSLWELLAAEAHLCFQGTLLSLAISASDKSAFCRIQLLIYDMPSTQKEKTGLLCLRGRESTSTCKHGAGLHWF